MNALFASLIVGVLAVWQVSPRVPAPQPINARAIDSVAAQLADSGFAGVVLVASGGKVLFRKSYGPASHVNGFADSFWIGSMTKGFTAAAILRLQEQKRLSLSDSIGRFFPAAPPEKRGITVRQLLIHTSGIDGSYSGGGITTRDSVVKVILSRPMSSRPGTHYRYMDDDYELLAAITEVASRISWESYVKRELIDRSGLRHTSFTHNGDWGHKGANGMSSTADDLLMWVDALKNGKVLSANDAKALTSGQIYVRNERGEDIYYGYGVRVYESQGRTLEVMHSGSSDEGNTVIARVLADGTTIIVLSSSGEHAGTTWSSYVARKLPIDFRRRN